jgi:hypothetical protein
MARRSSSLSTRRQTLYCVLRELRAILHPGLAQHALRAAVDLVQHVIPVERRQTRVFETFLDPVEQRPFRAHEAGPRLDHGLLRLGGHAVVRHEGRAAGGVTVTAPPA